jgi:cellulose synthase operon protein B
MRPIFAPLSHSLTLAKASAKQVAIVALLASCLVSSGSMASVVALANPAPSTTAHAVATTGGQQHVLTMKDLQSPDGYTLKTVRTNREYEFTRPSGWKMLPSTQLKLSFQHSPALLPERSSLNILVNHRILKTIPLGADNVKPTHAAIAIPADILKDRNTLEFQVDQHYTYKCEDPFSPELWTTILPETQLVLGYAPQAVHPDLSSFPFPLFDPLGYGPTQAQFVVPSGSLSDDSLSALGTVAVGLGQHVGWRPFTPTVTTSLSGQNSVLIGTPQENSAINEVASALGAQYAGGRWSGLSEGQGIIALVANPKAPSKGVLVISGNDAKGVLAAARVLVQKPANQLLIGQHVIVKEQAAGPAHPDRQWTGFIQQPGGTGTTFDGLGLDTLTTRGITGLPLLYPVKVMPDLYLPGKSLVQLKTVYSYASQLDPTQSKLEVKLNGKSIKSVALDNKAGASLAEVTLDLPAESVHTYNNLEYVFHLYPEKYDLCRFTTDAHIWGTVHNTSNLVLPGDIKAPLPDVGLINDAGYPFTATQDFSQVAAVVPQQASTTDLNTLVQILGRLGKESQSQTGINLGVYHANSIPDNVKRERHLILIGNEDKNSLFKDVKSKLHLLVSGNTKDLSGPDANSANKLASLNYSADQGVLEETLSPWNDNRVALLAFGANDSALNKIGTLFTQDSQFSAIQQGNLLVANGNGSKSLVDLKQGDAKFLYPSDLKGGGTGAGDACPIPVWAMWLVGILAVFGLLGLVKGLFGKR